MATSVNFFIALITIALMEERFDDYLVSTSLHTPPPRADTRLCEDSIWPGTQEHRADLGEPHHRASPEPKLVVTQWTKVSSNVPWSILCPEDAKGPSQRLPWRAPGLGETDTQTITTQWCGHRLAWCRGKDSNLTWMNQGRLLRGGQAELALEGIFQATGDNASRQKKLFV